jgi:hypothetical protein
MLDQIKIASPCSADWEQMEGNDRVRFCAECKKNVFNLSAMTRRDAEALIQGKNGDMCARLYRRADGTVLTEDCSVGFNMKVTHVRRKIGWVVAGALSFASAFAQEAASLSGRVMDVSGAVVPRAKITITDPKTGNAMQLESDEVGKFSESSLRPGSYTVKVVVPGFSEFQHPDTVVKASQVTTVEITLHVGTTGGVVVMAVDPDSVFYKAKLPSKLDVPPAKPKPWWRRLV